MKAIQNRKLAAILFADIVGYTSLMQQDEQNASTLLRHFQIQTESIVNAHNGQIVNFYGDGALCTFQIPIDSIRCAIDLQTTFRSAPEVPVRIGVHSGTVTVERDKIFGDAVNITSRIESMGVAGSILLSKKVRDEVKNNPDLNLSSMGNFEFKNVEEPIEIFAIANEGLVVPHRKDLRNPVAHAVEVQKSTYPKWLKIGAGLFALLIFAYFAFANYNNKTQSDAEANKSIAILPLRDLSHDQSQAYFADGVVEAIRSKLAQVGDLKVTSMTSVLSYRNNPKPISEIAEELHVRHILEGTVFKDENRVRIIVQLIDASTDEHIWAHTFDEELNDIFAIQTRIANEVTKELKAKITPEEKTRLESQTTTDYKAYDLYLGAMNDERKFEEVRDQNLLDSSIENLQKAIEIDPNFDGFYVRLASAWYYRPLSGYGEAAYDTTLHYAQIALDINPNNDAAYEVLSRTYWKIGKFEESKSAAEKALELAPNNSSAMTHLANYYLQNKKDFEKAIPLLLKAIALTPKNNNVAEDNFNLYANLGYLFLRVDMLDEADEVFSKAFEIDPNSLMHISNLGFLRTIQGKHTEAEKLFKRRYELSQKDFRSIDSYAFGLMMVGKFEESLKLYLEMENKVEEGFIETSTTRTYRHRLAFVLWQLGQKEKAQKMFDKHIDSLLDILKGGTRLRGQEYDLAGVYAFLGEKEKAYEWLDKMPYFYVTFHYLRIDPMFDSLRDEPRFQQILEKQNEEAERMQAQVKEYQKEGAFIFSVES